MNIVITKIGLLCLKTLLFFNIVGTFQQELVEVSRGSVPTIQGPEILNISAKIGDDVKIPCSLTGDPKPIQTWYKVIILNFINH